MASKLQIITAMFNDEVGKVTNSLDNWTSFLRTASNNFKYNFVEQILIYGQRPDATACAEIGFWNDKMHRWVNRGATGIALFDYSGSYQKLRYNDNLWSGKEFYEFLVKEAFVFEKDGSVLGIRDELLKDFKELSESNGVPVKDSILNPYWQQYNELKAENADKLFLYQVGDFFEALGEDAKDMAEALDLQLTHRTIGDNVTVDMCGIPKHRLETYLGMLTDRGFDVAVCSLESGERKTYTIVSQNKEDPVESKPVGRIDYLHTDGKVRESMVVLSR